MANDVKTSVQEYIFITLSYEEILDELGIPKGNALRHYPFNFKMKFVPKSISLSKLEDVDIKNQDNLQGVISTVNAFVERAPSYIGLSADSFKEVLSLSTPGQIVLQYLVTQKFWMEMEINVETIIEYTGKSSPTIYNGIKELTERNFIKKIKGRTYAINLDKVSTSKMSNFIEEYIAGRSGNKVRDIHSAIVSIGKKKLIQKMKQNEKQRARNVTDTVHNIRAYSE